MIKNSTFRGMPQDGIFPKPWGSALNSSMVGRNHDEASLIELVPLPSRAQFLNIIESVFSGMSRAVIHNSNFDGVSEAKKMIDDRRVFFVQKRVLSVASKARRAQAVGRGAL